MNKLPSGTVTFLFTDIEGSTKLAQQCPEDMPALLARHNEILQRSVEAQNGYIFQVVGDSISAAFSAAVEAPNAALDAQRCLLVEACNEFGALQAEGSTMTQEQAVALVMEN